MRTKLLLAFMCALVFAMPLVAQIAEVQQQWYQTDGAVRAMAEDVNTNTLYLGGDFGTVSPAVTRSYGALLRITSGAPNAAFARPDNPVFASVSDGTGGVFIGGDFENVNGVVRHRLAHILSDGSLDPWAVNVVGDVRTLALKGDTLVIGGLINTVNGAPRKNFALVHKQTGALFAMNPVFQGFIAQSIYASALKNDTLFVGGDFSAIDGVPRSGLAAFKLSTGALLAWNPLPSGGVWALAMGSGVLYVGGTFSTIGGQPRSNFAALVPSTGAATAINPGPNSAVQAIAVSAGQVYVGGSFTTFAGQARYRIAQISELGVAASWAPVLNDVVYCIAVQGSVAYVGGDFTSVNGVTRGRLAALGVPGSSEPAVTLWDPNADGRVWTMALLNTHIFVGGPFTSVGVLTRSHLVALDMSTGEPTTWNPGANNIVRALALGTGVLYVGGDFDHLGRNNAIRTRAGCIDLATQLATTWNPAADGTVNDIVLSGSSIVLGGSFTALNGIQRFGLSAVNNTTGAVTGWNASTGGAGQTVEQMIASNDTLYVCGTFSTLNGVTRGPLASIMLPGPSGGLVTSFAPLPNGPVHSIAKRGNTIYACGTFTTIGGLSGQNYVSAVNAVTGTNTGWNANVDVAQTGITANDHAVYFQCNKPDANGNTVYGLHSFDLATAQYTGLSLALDNSIYQVRSAAGGALMIGGAFLTVAGVPRKGFAVIDDRPAMRINALLGGPWNTTNQLMNDNLRAGNLLPATEPYTALGYTHSGGGGGETLGSAIATTDGANGAVDWVVLELRAAGNPATVVATRSALLQRDGDLIDPQGGRLLPGFAPDANALYYVALKHRNHLGVMTATPVSVKNGVLLRFADPATTVYGTDGRQSVGAVMVLWAGDVTFNGQIKYTGSGNDRDPILTTVGSTTPNNTVTNTYSTRDVTMDGQVKYTGSGNDRDPILVNVGSATPNNVRLQQVP